MGWGCRVGKELWRRLGWCWRDYATSLKMRAEIRVGMMEVVALMSVPEVTSSRSMKTALMTWMMPLVALTSGRTMVALLDPLSHFRSRLSS